jgi:branched-chain amino acid transport system permease protein
LLFGFAMVLIMIWRPRGLIATRVPSAFLHGRGRKTLLPRHVDSETGEAALLPEGHR